ncbi:hypothetical protein [Desulfosudis oleivorans]|nr:hypothetical protein [Desulfosudis oleivorans]
MLKAPPALMQKFNWLLDNSDIPPGEYPAYRTWLRFYLDFCKKYRHGYAEPRKTGTVKNKKVLQSILFWITRSGRVMTGREGARFDLRPGEKTGKSENDTG